MSAFNETALLYRDVDMVVIGGHSWMKLKKPSSIHYMTQNNETSIASKAAIHNILHVKTTAKIMENQSQVCEV